MQGNPRMSVPDGLMIHTVELRARARTLQPRLKWTKPHPGTGEPGPGL